MSVDDSYETGRVYPVDLDKFAADWRMEALNLRRALNLAAFLINIEVGQDGRKKRDELMEIAKCGRVFCDAIEAASPGSIIHLLVCLIGPGEVSTLLQQPEPYRRREVDRIRKFADQARIMAEKIVVTKAPLPRPDSLRSPPTARERAAVGSLADLWCRTHGERPNVTTRRPNERDSRVAGAERRGANEGGRFVIAAAALLDVELTDQRLRTVLASLQQPRVTET